MAETKQSGQRPEWPLPAVRSLMCVRDYRMSTGSFCSAQLWTWKNQLRS